MPNILIIEDQPALAESLRLALEGPGYAVRCAESAEQGMLFLLNWKVDVVIVDYMLPGMNGIELIKGITQIKTTDYTNYNVGAYCNTPLQKIRVPKIILLSARMDRELEREAMATGADACLAKPFDLDMLREKVKILTRKS
jgi:DNA-binding response OmpR family regulator